uniref:Uncharacterized protein n=1 Tax=Setaria italica TaxID=4555 RepID=K3ZEW3_SETIT
QSDKGARQKTAEERGGNGREKSPIGAWVAVLAPLGLSGPRCPACRQTQHEASVGSGRRGPRGNVAWHGRGRGGAFASRGGGYKRGGARSRSGPMRPPSLLSLTLDSALLRIAHIADLSSIPDHLVIDLFRRTLSAGKLTEKVLKLFLATGWCSERF